MNLSADLIAELVQGISTSDGERSKDQRRAPRVHYRGQITVIPQNGGMAERATTVEVVDFSQRGMCLSSTTSLSPGKQLLARFPRKVGDAVVVLCNVVHCRMLSNGFFSIGCEFVCRLANENALGPAGLQGTVDDIRNSILD